MSSSRRLLIYFASEHYDFRYAELQALLDLWGVQSRRCDSNPLTSAFAWFETDAVEQFCAAASRSVLVKSIHEFWGESASLTDLAAQMRELPANIASEPFEKPGTTFKITIRGCNKRLSSQHQLKRIEYLTENSVEWMKTGKVRLKDPQVELTLFEEYPPVSGPAVEGGCGDDEERPARGKAARTAPETSVSAQTGDQCEESNPTRFYFGRFLGIGMRTTLNRYSLSERYFIGSTTLDPCLASMMVNLGQVKQDAVVFDPFVGTGSILVAAAHCGAFVFGSDIDASLLYARCKNTRAHCKLRRRDESVRRNLVQYGLASRYLDVLVADAALNAALWRPQQLLDAIVTDPPYGIRESATRSDADADPDDADAGRRNKAKQYALDSLFCDLLHFAACRLCVGGRLVFWIPVFKPAYSEACVPTHPAFRLVANCEHPLFKLIARRLLVFQKTRECRPDDCATIEDFQYYRNFRESYFQLETS